MKTEIKQSVYDSIKSNLDLKDRIMEVMDIRETKLNNWIYRKSHNKIGHFKVVEVLKEFGIGKDEIFETEKV